MEGGLEVRLISSQAFAQYMSYRGYSVRSLAAKTGVHRATIGHLRSGARNACSPENARTIAKALDCPTEALFTAKVYRASRSIDSKRAA